MVKSGDTKIGTSHFTRPIFSASIDAVNSDVLARKAFDLTALNANALQVQTHQQSGTNMAQSSTILHTTRQPSMSSSASSTAHAA